MFPFLSVRRGMWYDDKECGILEACVSYLASSIRIAYTNLCETGLRFSRRNYNIYD